MTLQDDIQIYAKRRTLYVVIGLVYLDTRRRTDAFAEDDRPVVTALANGAEAIIPVAEISEALAIRARRPEVLLAGREEAMTAPIAVSAMAEKMMRTVRPNEVISLAVSPG